MTSKLLRSGALALSVLLSSLQTASATSLHISSLQLATAADSSMTDRTTTPAIKKTRATKSATIDRKRHRRAQPTKKKQQPPPTEAATRQQQAATQCVLSQYSAWLCAGLPAEALDSKTADFCKVVLSKKAAPRACMSYQAAEAAVKKYQKLQENCATASPEKSTPKDIGACVTTRCHFQKSQLPVNIEA